jgi:predicted  nucleic acid-binding Zn-ribbon protein
VSVVRQLYQLQLLDRELMEKSSRLAEVEEGLGESRDVVQARQDVAEAEGELKQLRSQLRALELDAESLNAKLKANQDRLYSGRVRNPKELSGLQGEAKALRRRRSELEDDQLELMIALEEMEAEVAERQARLRQIMATWREDQAALQAEKAQLELSLSELDDQRCELRARLGPDDLALYDDLYARLGGVAVVMLKRGVCQMCGVDVPTGVARSIERGEGLHFCPTCNRLLYGGGQGPAGAAGTYDIVS